MTDQQAHGKMRRVCPACGFIYFDDPKVAVVTFIERGHRVLLVRRAMNPERGKWALPAGYVDYGEDPRESARREVLEETGLEIEITRLISVEGSSGTFGASIVIVYAASVVNGAARPQDDVDAVLWLSASDPVPDLAFDSTRAMVSTWLDRQRSLQ
jgi:ADP-ribose pyrophosphatase YjhB (NUDIX family)